MKNKFEYEYLENDFERFYNFITVYTTSSEHERNVKKIFQKIENHYKDACVFIKEQSGIIDELTSNITSLENKLLKNINLYNDLTLENDNLQINLSQSYNTIEYLQHEIECYVQEIHKLYNKKQIP